MSRPMPWMERTFRNDHDVRLLPNVLIRLRGTPPRAAGLLDAAGVTPDRRPPDGRWSALEHIGHLAILEELHENRLDDYRSGLPELRPADLTNRATEEARINRTPVADVLARLRAARGRFVAAVERVPPEVLGRPARHPRLKIELRLIDYLVFIAEHDDHHLAHALRLLDPDGR